MLFSWDICMCASEECPRYNQCLRGSLTKRQGIYTQSFLSEICNEENDYKYQIKEDEK